MSDNQRPLIDLEEEDRIVSRYQYYVKISREFAALIEYHFQEGTEPQRGLKNTSWSNTLMAELLGVSVSAVSGWRNGHTYPKPTNFFKLLQAFFGNNYWESRDADELIHLYNLGSSYSFPTPLGSSEEDLEQKPAAFKFQIKDGKIDSLPEYFEKIDSEMASDIHSELISKTQDLSSKMFGSNAGSEITFYIDRLECCVNKDFNLIRPGLVLSRMRSVEAIQNSYDTEEGKQMLYPGAIAALNDVVLTGRDFLSLFPVVREIERQRIGIDIARSPKIIEKIEVEIAKIQDAAEKSEIVTTEA